MSNVPTVLTEQKVETLTREILKLPQANCPVIHSFAPGLYIREVMIPAGTVSVGHFQKTEHYNIMLTGRVIMVNEDGSKVELVAPITYVSKPGRKIGYILEDMIWQNVYPTTETDIEKLEEMFLNKNDIWEEHKRTKQLLLAFDRGIDIDDYYAVLEEYNLDATFVRNQVETTSDLIPFPSGSYKVRVADSNIEGKGLFASGNIKEGEVIAPARIDFKRTPAGRYTNHAKVPNAKMVRKDNGDIDLVALRDISGMHGGELGEEITIDYRQAIQINKENLICHPQ